MMYSIVLVWHYDGGDDEFMITQKETVSCIRKKAKELLRESRKYNTKEKHHDSCSIINLMYINIQFSVEQFEWNYDGLSKALHTV